MLSIATYDFSNINRNISHNKVKNVGGSLSISVSNVVENSLLPQQNLVRHGPMTQTSLNQHLIKLLLNLLNEN